MTTPSLPPTPAPEPAAPAPAPAPSAMDPQAEVARLQAELDAWKGHARNWENKAKANLTAAEAAASRDAQLAKVAEALGIAEAKPDPEAIARQLEATKAEAKARATEIAVLRAAQATGANGNELLDSRSFLAKVADLDPNDLDAVKAAVTAAVAANPKYGPAAPAAPAAPAPPAPRQASTAGQFDGQPGGERQLGAEDMKRMTSAQIADAGRKGLFRDYLNSPNT